MSALPRPFNPPARVLMGPGPSDVPPRILAALARPTVGHLDPSFIQLMDEVKALLQMAFMTGNDLTLPVSGPGSAGMETCFVNLLEPGDTAIVAVNGVFGQRMKENVERAGAGAVLVEVEWGHPVDPAKVEAALKAHPEARLLAFVHAETSTGVESDAETLCALARKYDALSVVDCVTSLGGIPVRVDAWGADAVYSGSQKCLSCVPGLSPVTFSPRAVQRIRGRNRKVQSWFMDLNLVMGYWGAGAKRAYHHTAPINALYALHESLLMLAEEGLEKAWARHLRLHLALRAGIEAMGLSFLADESCRLPQLNAVRVPEGIDEASVRTQLLERFGIELGAGLGPLAGKIWRIGLMGASASASNVLLCLGALESTLAGMKAPIHVGAALPAAMAKI
ncbi:MAG: alanine--glyoxylate aminotransferase family protein [Alphaproteobacteria bacterium]|nr:alanine--glyoxylate aminotransferase family protein [Alphaproteobacteria bacterium]